MHYYICPYCKPNRSNHLVESSEEDYEYQYEDCDEKDCIDIIQYTCNQCHEHFLGTVNFLKEQKRKIKDG